jgi:hypothetical protein
VDAKKKEYINWRKCIKNFIEQCGEISRMYLLPFSKLPAYNSMNNIIPDWNIENITIQNHKALIFIVEVCYSSYQILVLS